MHKFRDNFCEIIQISDGFSRYLETLLWPYKVVKTTQEDDLFKKKKKKKKLLGTPHWKKHGEIP
jgi:CRISPR/Cas system CSM-associated protein Csm4 (group 5 of RAMP superfamily)